MSGMPSTEMGLMWLGSKMSRLPGQCCLQENLPVIFLRNGSMSCSTHREHMYSIPDRQLKTLTLVSGRSCVGT